MFINCRLMVKMRPTLSPYFNTRGQHRGTIKVLSKRCLRAILFLFLFFTKVVNMKTINKYRGHDLSANHTLTSCFCQPTITSQTIRQHSSHGRHIQYALIIGSYRQVETEEEARRRTSNTIHQSCRLFTSTSRRRRRRPTLERRRLHKQQPILLLQAAKEATYPTKTGKNPSRRDSCLSSSYGHQVV